MTMTVKQGLPLPTAPLVDPETGLITREWLQVFSVLLVRTGGAAGSAGTVVDVANIASMGFLADEPADFVDLSAVQQAVAVFPWMADPPEVADTSIMQAGLAAPDPTPWMAEPADAIDTSAGSALPNFCDPFDV